MILNRIVELRCGKFDKYARVLITIVYKDTNVNQLLIDNKLVKTYEGKTKTDWSEQELQYIMSFDVEQFKIQHQHLFQNG